MERKTGLSKWPILYRTIAAAQFRRFGLGTLAYDLFRFVSWLDRPTFCQQLQIEPLGVLKSWQFGVEPKAAHLVLIGSAGIEHGHSDGLHELAVTEEDHRAGLVGQTSQPAQRNFRASEQGDETLRAGSVAIDRIGGVPVVLDVGEPFASGGSVPPAGFQIREFFDGPLLHGDGGKSVASGQGGLLCPEVRGNDNQRWRLGPLLCNLPGLFPSLFRQLQLGQVVTWTSGVADAFSVANKNGAHKSTLRGAGKIRPEAKSNAGFITRGSIAKRPQAYFG